jgi:hypothetical protein
VKLDNQYDWVRQPIPRIFLQLVAALLLPAVAAFLLAFVYFRAYGVYILDTVYLTYDFPVIVGMLILLNVYYLAFYFYRRSVAIELALLRPAGQKNDDDPGETVQEIFMVQRGAQTIPLPATSIAIFYREGDHNFLKTFDEESYLVAQTLDETEQQLDRQLFFRANRQVIVQYKACTHFSNLDFGKLKLFTKPSLKRDIVISQRRVKQFKQWMRR